jgi:hypothetical protein
MRIPKGELKKYLSVRKTNERNEKNSNCFPIMNQTNPDTFAMKINNNDNKNL